jgi:mutual gliding-motility protein MglA
MAIFNYAAREMTAKIVYYGPGLSGKTTSIQYVHTKISPKNKGKLVSLATETDRTLFFDFFPVEFGQIGGFKVKFNFYTVPGQVFYNTTRKLVLKGADGVVFVADSQPGMTDQNQESLQNLKDNLKGHGIDWETVPFIIQYNKRDIPGALPLEEMRRLLNVKGMPDFETVATNGAGIMEAMKAICRMVLEDIQKKQRRTSPRAVQSRPVPAPFTEPGVVPRVETASPEVKERAVAAFAGGPTAPARPAGIERTIAIPIRGPGSSSLVLRLPLELELEAGVDAIEVAAELRIAYGRGRGQALVRELSVEASPMEPPARRGFLARLFGRG